MSHCIQQFPKTFSSFYKDQETSDVTLVFDGESFPVHRVRWDFDSTDNIQLVLALHSDVFKELLYAPQFEDGSKREVALENACEVDRETFETLLLYLYCNELRLTAQNVVKLYELSDFYQIGHLRHFCIRNLYDEIKTGNYFPALEMVNRNHDEELLRLCLDAISQELREGHIDRFCSRVTYSSLLKALRHDWLSVGEDLVLKVAVTFIELQTAEEHVVTSQAVELLKCVRFHLMPGENLVRDVQPLVERGWVSKDHFTQCLVCKFDPAQSPPGAIGGRKYQFRWDVADMQRYHDYFSVEDDGRVVKRTNSAGVNPSIRTTRPLSPANPAICVEVRNFNKWNCFGVVASDYRLIGEFVGNKATSPDCGFGVYIGSTSSYCYVKNASNVAQFSIGQRIIRNGDMLTLQLVGDCIIFLVNDEELGTARLKNKQVEYYPCLSMGYLSEWAIV